MKKYICQISDKFFATTSFILIILLILSMPMTYFVKAFSIYNIHSDDYKSFK